MRNKNLANRRAFTLLELAVCLISSMTLIGGLAASIYLSSQALPGNENASRQKSKAAAVLRDVMADVSLAVSFTERTSRAITFRVPDRSGDGSPDTIRYAWSGTAGDPLMYQFNSEAAVSIATGVQAFNLEVLTRTMLAEQLAAPVAGNVVLESFMEGKRNPAGTNVAVTIPTSTAQGDLLIAAVSVDGDVRTSLIAPTGWTAIHLGPIGPTSGTAMQTFGVYWKLALAGEPPSYTFTWTGSKQAYAWVMRFTGHNTTSPIHTSAYQNGATSALAIPSPAVTTTVENAMILRLGGFDGRNILVDSPGLLLHTPITMDYSAFSSLGASGGAGYVNQPTAGNSGSSSFTLVGVGEEYTTVTIAIAPATMD
jgi:type II secretory pathway pseudopilin PulG